MNSKANDRQVAGTHYQGKVQHWDYAGVNQLGYFEGQITKYVVRWRTKWPTAAQRLDDIEKAAHFAEKWAELLDQGVFTAEPTSAVDAEDYAVNAGLGWREVEVFVWLESTRLSPHSGQALEQLQRARTVIEMLVAEAKEAMYAERRAAVAGDGSVQDEAAVVLLAREMRTALAARRKEGRGGWLTVDSDTLLESARLHVVAAQADSHDSPPQYHAVAAANYLAFALANMGG